MRREQAEIRAIEMLESVQGTYTGQHINRAAALADVLVEHPRATLVMCCDERTGKRFGQAKCRRGRCVKIGSTTYKYQLWAEW